MHYCSSSRLKKPRLSSTKTLKSSCRTSNSTDRDSLSSIRICSGSSSCTHNKWLGRSSSSTLLKRSSNSRWSVSTTRCKRKERDSNKHWRDRHRGKHRRPWRSRWKRKRRWSSWRSSCTKLTRISSTGMPARWCRLIKPWLRRGEGSSSSIESCWKRRSSIIENFKATATWQTLRRNSTEKTSLHISTTTTLNMPWYQASTTSASSWMGTGTSPRQPPKISQNSTNAFKSRASIESNFSPNLCFSVRYLDRSNFTQQNHTRPQ